jgi:hypothetical protein
MSMNGNGFRTQPQTSKKDKLRELDAYVSNLTAASRITQAMIQQLIQNSKNIGDDLNRALGMLNELQYKVLALQKFTSVSPSELNAEIETMRLKDFTDASDKEDAEKKYAVVDTVAEDSVVILTSTTASSPDRGFFRSKIKLSESGVPDLISGLVGKTVGHTLSVKLNGEDHAITLLGVRQPPQADGEQKLQLVQ